MKNKHTIENQQQITFRPKTSTLNYFRSLSGEVQIPYLLLINLALMDCATNNRISKEMINGISLRHSKCKKSHLTTRIEKRSINYFRQTSDKFGIPYQSLINCYLDDCVERQRKIKFYWE